MKRFALSIATLAAATLISALPALAADEMGNRMMDQDQQGRKDECVLMSKNCGDRIDTIQQKIMRISHEIDRGSAVYTSSELRHLDFQLEEAKRTLEELTQSGGV